MRVLPQERQGRSSTAWKSNAIGSSRCATSARPNFPRQIRPRSRGGPRLLAGSGLPRRVAHRLPPARSGSVFPRSQSAAWAVAGLRRSRAVGRLCGHPLARTDRPHRARPRPIGSNERRTPPWPRRSVKRGRATSCPRNFSARRGRALQRADARPADPDWASEAGVLETVDAVTVALEAHGQRVTRLPVGNSVVEVLAGLSRRPRPDVVFNLCEGLGGTGARRSPNGRAGRAVRAADDRRGGRVPGLGA